MRLSKHGMQNLHHKQDFQARGCRQEQRGIETEYHRISHFCKLPVLSRRMLPVLDFEYVQKGQGKVHKLQKKLNRLTEGC